MGYGVNVSANLGFGSSSAGSSWVGEQTSIVGRSVVDIYVEGNTHLGGSIIATDRGGDLLLNTGTLTYEEIQDQDEGTSWNASVSGGFTVGDVGFDKDAKFLGMKPIDYTSGADGSKPYIPDAVEYEYASRDKEGVLRPTVTEGTIIVRDDPNADLSGLNRDVERAREITKDASENVDAYISPSAIVGLLERTILKGHEKDVSLYGFVPNLFPGLFINKALTGQETWETSPDLEFKLTDGNYTKNQDVIFLASDENPFLQILYHLVPGFKSSSEIHDVQMKIYEENTRQDLPLPFITMTIPGSFARSYIYAVTVILDIENWGKNLENIRNSYTLRKETPH
jgi:filamentous hemagglutinin